MNKSYIKNFISNLMYSYRVVQNASKKYFIYKLILTLTLSLLPFIPIYLWKEILNSLVKLGIKHDTQIISMIVFLTIAYSVALFAEQILSKLSEFVNYKYNDAINYYLDNLMVEKVSNIDLAFFDSSDLSNKLNNSWNILNSLQSLIWMVFGILEAVIKIVISFFLLASLNIWIAAFVVILSIPALFSQEKMQELEYAYERQSSKTYRKMSYYKEQFFNKTVFDVRLYNLKPFFIDKYKKEWVSWFKGKKRILIKGNMRTMACMLLLSASEIAMFALSIMKLAAKKIGVGDVQYYLSLLSNLRDDVERLIYAVVGFSRAMNELSDVRDFIELKPMLEKSGTLIPNALPEIKFNNVSFKYPGSEDYVLKNCSFTIEKGCTVGLVGLNGSGKTTIVKLLLRFYDPVDGEILIDGVNSKEYDIKKLRARFGVLFQDYAIYSFTARENITLSDIDRSDDIKAINEACRQSKVDEIIKDWDKGIDENLTTYFDKDGKQLSGGQWQRIALARVFFRKTDIIILDEPSAALDPEAEHEIFEQFKRLSKNKSAVLISHRLSSITIADKIIVLEGGRIIEEGSHRELLKLNGRYSYLFNLQASKYSLKEIG